MNGRVYDYNLGRFLSVDPVIQSPTNTQSMNPYSYIMNNPLAGTDPSGYCGVGVGVESRQRCEPMTFDKVMESTSRSTMAGGWLKRTSVISLDNGMSKSGHTSADHNGEVADIGSQQQSAKSANYEDFSVSNDGLDDVVQSTLSEKEKKRRLQLLDVISIDSGQLSQGLAEQATLKTQHYLNNIALTDEGATLLENYSGEGITVNLCEKCVSSRSFNSESGKDRLNINIWDSDFETAEGENTFVQLSGMRTLAHELVHATRSQIILPSIHKQNETEAVQRANIIMKQHFQRIGFPGLSGARNRYGKARRQLPKGAILKEKWGDGYDH